MLLCFLDISRERGSSVADFEMKKRQSVSVFISHLRQSKQLRRFGDIIYVSRRMKYVVIYMDQDQVTSNVQRLKQLGFVKKVVVSPRNQINMNFDETLSKYRLTEEDQEKIKDQSEEKWELFQVNTVVAGSRRCRG